MTDLTYTPAVAERTAAVFDKVSASVSAVEWPLLAPVIDEINRLKRERNAVILAHNYMRPEIFHGVADVVGDSLALARKGAETDAEVIVMAGVHFMAETAKVLSPEKTVLMPDMAAGCSLSESITAEDMKALRARYPGVPIVVYVNTSAEVKAEADICCTSGNAVEVVESLGVPQVIMAPDRYLAAYVQSKTKVKIIAYDGACEVHEQYTAEDINDIRETYDGDITVIAHPECPEEVIAAADFAGSTAQMADFIAEAAPKRVLLVTECSMGDNLIAQAPKTEFVRTCHMCPHMKRITVDTILRSLQTLEPRVEIEPAIIPRARQAVERMLTVKRNAPITVAAE